MPRPAAGRIGRSDEFDYGCHPPAIRIGEEVASKHGLTRMDSLASPSTSDRAAGSSKLGRVLIVTDAWHPQINGITRTFQRMSDMLPRMGVEVELVTPLDFRTVPMPSYPSIRLAVTSPDSVRRRIEAAKADHIHVVTEGPLGVLARRACLREKRPFTTTYHTKFPEYISARAPIPEGFTYGLLRRFHNSGAATLVATASLRADLQERGFTKVRPWTRGVDLQRFRPDHREELDLPRPIFLYVGRVAVEKNLDAFLSADLPGSKLVVGHGPALPSLKARYPEARFMGEVPEADLPRIYASSDVFVFPSLTDTFGIVLLEALASGLPVAAYPVTGPRDVITADAGILSDDLRQAALDALDLDREAARAHALTYSWDACAQMLLDRFEEVYAQAPARL